MKKIFKNKKNIIIISIILLVITIFSIFAYKNYSKNTALNLEIAQYSEKFNAEAAKEEKVKIFNELVNNKEKYSNKKVKENYENSLKDLKNWFVENYNNEFEANTINDLETNLDKDLITQSKTNLEALLNSIKSDGVATEEEVINYESMISEKINLYDNRLNEIRLAEEKAEAERQAKAEEERKAQEAKKAQEAAANSKPSTSSSNSSSASSGGSSSGSSINRDGENGGFGKRKLNSAELATLEYGALYYPGTEIIDPKTEHYVDRRNFNTYDMNGNYTGSAIW